MSLSFRSIRGPELRLPPGVRWLTRNRWQTLPFWGIYAILAYWVGKWIAWGIWDLVILATVGVIVGFIILAILADWQRGFYLFLVWLVFEDLIRKFLGNNMVLYFGKDLLVGVVYLAFLVSRKRGRVLPFRPPFLVPLVLFCAWGFVQVLNPNAPSLIYGLVGLKLYFYYVPLMFLGYALVGSEALLRRFLTFNLGMAGLVGLLGCIQAVVGLDFLNPPALAPELEPLGRLVRQAPISGVKVPRPTSIFVSDGRFAWYMGLTLTLGLGAAGFFWLRPIRGLGSRVVYGSLGVIALAIVLSGSRGTFLIGLGTFLVLTGGFLWGTFRRWGKGRQAAPLLLRTLVLVGCVLVVAVTLFPEAVGARWAFYYETLAPWNPTSELEHRVWHYPLMNFLGAFSFFPAWPIGYGLGTNSLGQQYITSRLGLPRTGVGVESGYGTIVIEMGIVGLGLWLVWSLSLIRHAWRVAQRLRGTSLFPLAFAIFWFVFDMLFVSLWGGMQRFQNFINNAYLWLLVGILFRLPQLEKTGPSGSPAA